MDKILIKLAYKILNKYNSNPTQIEKDRFFFYNNKLFSIVQFKYEEGLDRVTSLDITAYEIQFLNNQLYDKNK